MAEGLIDTNVFIHAQSNDSVAAECRAFLRALEAGLIRARLEPLVLHELSYALPRYLKQMTRQQVAAYLAMVVSWGGIVGDKDAMGDAIQRWYDTPGLSFADAYLAARAGEQRCPIYSKNVRELRAQGAVVPDPLPTGA